MQEQISQAQKDAIKRIRKAQDKALAGKIGDETVMIDLDVSYHHSHITKPYINVSFSLWRNGECDKIYYNLKEDCCSRIGSDDEEISYEEFFEIVTNHIGYKI